jgi:hypothetical protein
VAEDSKKSPMLRKRFLLTGNERWVKTVLARDVKESCAKGQVYARVTRTVLESVREVELDCGHWVPYRYDGGKKATLFCVQCIEERDADQ